MNTIRKTDLTIHDGLAIVELDGFSTPAESEEGWGSIDPPGSANYLCEAYGMADDDQTTGILWTDYDYNQTWRFSVLIDASEVEDLTSTAQDAGYEVIRVDEITEPTRYGDGNGTVEILKHRDGWVVIGD
jgi:hypothetical protein